MGHWIRYVVLMLGVVACLGCGSERDRGKNKDLDRPKPAEKAS
jgi:hypothetical protein